MAGIEAINVARQFGSWPIEGSTLDREGSRKLMEESTILYIATHGEFDKTSAVFSYVSFKEKVRVLDLAQSRSRASLIVFAVCFSGIGLSTQVADILGFLHAVLEAGCLSYIGSLWEVNDVAAMLLMILL